MFDSDFQQNKSGVSRKHLKGSGLLIEGGSSRRVPSMEETIQEIRKASRKGQHMQALQSMSKQWHSIKYFSKLYSTINQEIQKPFSNFKGVIQKIQATLDVEHEKESAQHGISNNFEYDRVYTKAERQARIKRYLKKKKNRKKKYFIRYEIRKTLANNRLRNKGKFIKNKKIDINKLIELVKEGRRGGRANGR